jgi:hypothetical protein
MLRTFLPLCVALTASFSGSFALAAVSSYAILPSTFPPFRYTGGDTAWVAIGAQLSGVISISVDDSTRVAAVNLDNVLIHSAYGTVDTGERVLMLPDSWSAAFYEGKTLPELDSFDPSIPGQIISPSEIKFGPTFRAGLTEYVQYLKFTESSGSYRLSGGSFISDDSPNYYIEAQLIPIPEPSTIGCLIVAFPCLGRWRRRTRNSPAN